MRSRTAAALAALVLLASACTGATDKEAALDWADCGDGFECAKLAVPLDHEKPDGEKIEISVIRLPASGDRIGSILINPGGPGASGVQYARGASSALSQAVRARFDVVGFDPRGVGDSSPVRCLSRATWTRYVGLDGTPDTPRRGRRAGGELAAVRLRVPGPFGRAPAARRHGRRRPGHGPAARRSRGHRASPISASRTARSWAPSTPTSSPTTSAPSSWTARWTPRSPRWS